MKNKWILVCATVFILIIMMVILWLRPSDPANNSIDVKPKVDPQSQQVMVDEVPSIEANNNSDMAATARGGFVTGLENLPQSLRDTDVDGDIIIDGNKQLVVTEGLRRLFDYFLSASGEEDEAAIIARVEAYISSHTPEPAASQAITIFHQYINYLKALGTLEQKYGGLQMQATQQGEIDLSLINQRTQDISKLRHQFFSDETIKAFFAEEDQLNDYTVAMLEIDKNDTLSEEQKQAQRDAYISRLPDGATKQRIKQKQDFNTLMAQTEALKAKGASAAELYAMRSRIVGEPAAQRLAVLDEQEADFDNRFTQYQQGKQALVAKAGSEAQAQAQIRALEKQLFNETEQKRLTGYAALKAAQQEAQQAE